MHSRVTTRGTAPEYLLEARLGHGAMGVVYLGKMVTPAGERRVAIKQLPTSGSEDDERLIAEACLAFRLNHANICQVLDLGVGEQGWFMVMEYVRGLDLLGLMRRLEASHQSLDVAHAVFIACEVAQALDYAHRRSDDNGVPLFLVHSDVAPTNILLSEEGEVKLTDFGIARALLTLAPGNELRGGTPGFTAPEVGSGTVDQRADIYSLGATLVAALAGSANASFAELATRRADLPSELVQILRRATQARPEERFATAAELKQALAFFLARRFPGYTSSELARLVRSQAARQERSPEVRVLTLQSRREASERPDPDDDEQNSTSAEVVSTERVPASPRKDRDRVLPAALVSLVLAGGVGAWLLWQNETPPPQPQIAPPMAVTPVAAPIPVVVPAPVAPKNESQPAAPRVANASRNNGYLTINSSPWGVVLIDGRKRADFTPAYKLPVAPGKHRVQIVSSDGASHSATQEVVVEPDKTKTLGFHF